MKRKSIRSLQIISTALQAAALVILLGMTVAQSAVKTFFAGTDSLSDIFSIPVQSLIKIVPMLAIYVAGLLIIGNSSQNSRKMLTGILIGIAIFFRIVPLFTDRIATIILGQYGGVNALVSQNTLESAITMITNPLTLVAFTLFCFACGGCYGIEEQN